MSSTSLFDGSCVRFFVFLYLLNACAGMAFAQESVLQGDISDSLNTLEQSTSQNLSKEQSDQAIKDLKEAQDLLTQAQVQRSLASSYEEDAAGSGQRISQINQAIEDLRSQAITVDTSLSVDELENQMILAVSEQSRLLSAIKQKQDERSALNKRASNIANELRQARAQYSEIDSDTKEQNSQGLGLIAKSKWLKKRATLVKLESTIQALEREVATIPSRQSIAEAELRQLRAQNEVQEQRIKKLREVLADDRSSMLNRIKQESQETLDTLNQHPLLRAIAAENTVLAGLLDDLNASALESETSSGALGEQLVEVQQSSETVERVLATGRVTDELGELLRKLRARLPSQSAIESRKTQIEEDAVRRQLDLILWQERLRNLSDPQASGKRLLNNRSDEIDNTIGNSFDSAGLSEFQITSAAQLVQARQTILQELIALARYQTDRINEEKLVINQLMTASAQLRELLEQRLIWLPSNSGKAGNLGINLKESLQWLLTPNKWWDLLQSFYRGVKQIPVLPILLSLMAIGILVYRNKLKGILWSLVDSVGKVSHDTYFTTPLALLLTLILALPLPLFLFAIASLIAEGANDEIFSSAVATGLRSVSSLSLVLLFFRSMSRQNGLFEKHFDWSEMARTKLRQMLTWFVWLQSIAAFTFAISLSSGLAELRYGLAIIAFIAGSIGISIFSYQFFQPKRGVATNIVGETPTSMLTMIAFPIVVLLPLIIGLMPLFGFFDTAVELQTKLFVTGSLLIFSATLYGLMLRTFLVAFRRYISKKEKQAEQNAQKAINTPKAEASGDATPIIEEEKGIDKEDVMRQSRSIILWTTAIIFITGLWFVWNPLLPALGIIDDIVLWQETKIVDGVELSSGVTLWNIILSIGFVVGGFIAARNIRGVMEIGFFERFQMDAGARYATLTILGYVLVGTGIVIGFSQLGIDWSKLQWIIAALGVGLGFGLQEIVANFVSGLIILFERPIRVGDFVTIGNLSGTVSNIKIRATTITDFDNREVLLPNKSIITENVTNWTLKDAVTRIVVKIGVAYGSDIENVRNLLMGVVKQHKEVLEQPAPQVLFLEHGDSSLNFEIRVFVGRPEERLPLTHSINAGINATLKSNNIAIPFPQRDLHIVSGSLGTKVGE